MKKFGFIFVLLLFFGLSFANECSKIGNIGEIANSKYFELYFSKTDLEIARANLSGYCNNDTSYSFLQSPYWYDHLVDVLLRKLDARDKDIYPGMDPDEKAKDWVEFITDIEKTKNPSEVFTEYKKNWTQTRPLPSIDENKIYSSFLDLQNSLENLSLYDKYINACFLSMVIYYGGITVPDPIDINKGHYNRCLSLARNRILQEIKFARSVSQYSAANMLIDSWTTYTSQFTQNRLMKLFDRIGSIGLLFNTFGSQAPLEKECTK